MKGKEIVFSLVFISLYIVVNYYIGSRFIKSIDSFYNINPIMFWIGFWIIAFSYIIGRFLKGFININIVNFLSMVGYYWIGIVFFSLAVLPIIDIGRIIVNKTLGKNIDFNARLMTAGISLVILAVFIILFILGSMNARKSIVYKIEIDRAETNLEDNLNIVMVSDIHLGTIVGSKRLEKMVNEINQLKPDIVIIAGDIVDTEIEPFINANMAKGFEKINSTYGTFASLGNHDLILGKGDIITEELRKYGVNILRDESVLVNDSFYIIGRDDSVVNRLGAKRKDLEAITKNLEKEKFKIVIDHTPNSIAESELEGVNLHFSGHTHRGQVIPGNLITKRIFELDYGHLIKKDLHVIVSCGYGTWGPPIRLGSKSEIVNVIIE